VDGLRGRLIATKAADVDGHPQARLELELENVTGSSIALWWDETPPSVLRVSLEDQGGIALPSAGVGGSFGAPPPHWVQLAPGSRRTTVSDAVYEYVPGGRTLIRPMTFQGWEMPSAGHGPLYLGGLFTGVKAPEPGHHAWTGPLKLPRVALP
jgi:hypothetical protein